MIRRGLLACYFLCAAGLLWASSAALPFTWPPKLNEAYPDFEFSVGSQTKHISSMKGKIVLVEMIGMNCPACQSWAGASKKGAFEGITPQSDLQPFEETFKRYTGGLSLDDPRIVYVQLLLFNMQMKAPRADDVKRWSEHFHKGMSHKPIVLAGAPEFLLPPYYQKTYDLVPGFQIIDKHGILRYDATGHSPRHNLWTDALPAIPKLLDEK